MSSGSGSGSGAGAGAGASSRRTSFFSKGVSKTAEQTRLEASQAREADWKNWGTYVSDRAWGTVREDYSPEGDAWGSFPHDHSRSRAYRWNEDGIAGFCNRFQNVVLSVGLWNGRDAILKERLFGLTGPEGNHGEDVKELYYYVDNTPTHSYSKMVYKYPMDAYPYEDLVRSNAARSRSEPEYELIDSMKAEFEAGHYWDTDIEYAKADQQDILCRITVTNRSKDRTDTVHVLPHFWCRNNWSWGYGIPKPKLSMADGGAGVVGEEAHLGRMRYWARGADGESGEWLFTENETNFAKLYPGQTNAGPFTKDGFHEYIVSGVTDAVNPAKEGTKVTRHLSKTLGPGESFVVQVRFVVEADAAPAVLADPFAGFDDVFAARLKEADEFYDALAPPSLDADTKLVQRQGFAGLLYTKQFYHYGVAMSMEGDPAFPPPSTARTRNKDWKHFYAVSVISMPDKWEYPWFAAWDLAFHTIPLALVDPEWAKRQLLLLLREWYMHPNGGLPAYEWNFSDTNPPVHGWACLRVFQISRKRCGSPDFVFLERCFHKLLINFSWWSNRLDAEGRNLFSGGFLGLDNIGIFDRSTPELEGITLEQSDATSWMAMYCLNMLKMALILTEHSPAYEDMASKFLEHFFAIVAAISGSRRARDAEGPDLFTGEGDDEDIGLWDEEDGFYYDRVVHADGRREFIKIKSLVGLIPLYATLVIKEEVLERLPAFKTRMEWFLRHRATLVRGHISWERPGAGNTGSGKCLLSLVTHSQLERMLPRLLSEDEFLSPYGFRSLSKEHETKPYHFSCGSYSATLRYEPAESSSPMYGGNSSWRGAIWVPTSLLLLESLQVFDHFHGDRLQVEFPTGSKTRMSLWDVSQAVSTRMINMFRVDEGTGKRPFNGGVDLFSKDPAFKDLCLFYEYFHGDNGAGIGASHQTGWTACICKLIQQSGYLRKARGDSGGK